VQRSINRMLGCSKKKTPQICFEVTDELKKFPLIQVLHIKVHLRSFWVTELLRVVSFV